MSLLNPLKLQHILFCRPRRSPRRPNDESAKPPHYPVEPSLISTESREETLHDGNKTNNGQIFLENGRPFWQLHKENSGDTDFDDDVTDSELPMNAKAIMDINRGKLDLIEMPRGDDVVMDPFGPIAALHARDTSFFTRDVIFSNTMRTILNFHDKPRRRRRSGGDSTHSDRTTGATTSEASNRKRKSTSRGGKRRMDDNDNSVMEQKCHFEVSKEVYRYSRKQPDHFETETYVPFISKKADNCEAIKK